MFSRPERAASLVVALPLLCLLLGCQVPSMPQITLAPTLTASPSYRQPTPQTPTLTPTAGPTSTPEPTLTPSPTLTPRTYTVQKGDLLGKIAERYGVTMRSIAEANSMENPNRLSIGQVLIIPHPTATPGPDGPTATPTATRAPAITDQVVFITAEGSEYHREWCTELRQGKIPITCREAVSLGYERCQICQPGCW